jgi:hypothetical protein
MKQSNIIKGSQVINGRFMIVLWVECRDCPIRSSFQLSIACSSKGVIEAHKHILIDAWEKHRRDIHKES